MLSVCSLLSSTSPVAAAAALVALTLTGPASAHDTRQLAHSHALARRAAPTIDGWKSLGCVTEGTSGKRALTGYSQQSIASLTIQSCLNTCASMAYLYGGVEFGQECWCSDTLSNGGGVTAADSNCDAPCTGDSSVMCGGTSYLTMYQSTDTTCAATTTTTSTSSALAALPTATITSGGTSWAPQGCVQDGGARLLQGSRNSLADNTPSKCVASCLSQGYSYAGVEAGYICMCGSSLNTASGLGSALDDSLCMTSACTGDSAQSCGGSYKMILYKETAGSAATTTTAATTTSTSAAVATTASGTIVSGKTIWTAQGCVRDNRASLLSGSANTLATTNTPSACIALCLSQGFAYAGVEYGKSCYCGSYLDTENGIGSKLDDSDCDAYKCTGDSSLSCGAGYKMLLYKRTAITSGSTTWKDQGCVRDSADLLLSGSANTLATTNTPSTCIALCLSQGFSYAGVEYGKRCFCGSSLNTSGGMGSALSDLDCTGYKCTGDSSQPCGAGYKMILFKKD